jgi:hypothetical protein
MISVLALLCSLWFLALGWAWVYFINIVFVFPIAILGFILWRKSNKEKTTLLNRITGIILLTALATSLGSLVLYR